MTIKKWLKLDCVLNYLKVSVPPKMNQVCYASCKNKPKWKTTWAKTITTNGRAVNYLCCQLILGPKENKLSSQLNQSAKANELTGSWLLPSSLVIFFRCRLVCGWLSWLKTLRTEHSRRLWCLHRVGCICLPSPVQSWVPPRGYRRVWADWCSCPAPGALLRPAYHQSHRWGCSRGQRSRGQLSQEGCQGSHFSRPSFPGLLQLGSKATQAFTACWKSTG